MCGLLFSLSEAEVLIESFILLFPNNPLEPQVAKLASQIIRGQGVTFRRGESSAKFRRSQILHRSSHHVLILRKCLQDKRKCQDHHQDRLPHKSHIHYFGPKNRKKNNLYDYLYL